MYQSKFDYNNKRIHLKCRSDAIPRFGAPEYNNVVSDAFFYLKSNINTIINKRMIIK